MGDGDRAKAAAGLAAAGFVEDGMRLGLGTGSTMAYFLDAVAARSLDVAGVPTSEATAERCRELGIVLLPPEDGVRLDLAVDGADELTGDLQLTKGGGGALLREKVVASAAARFLVIATSGKLVERLGSSFALPVEVIPFAVPNVASALGDLGGDEVATRGEGEYRTDNGNVILDVTFHDGIEDVHWLDVALNLVPGVAAHGLFVDMASEALLGTHDGEVQRLLPATDDESAS